MRMCRQRRRRGERKFRIVQSEHSLLEVLKFIRERRRYVELHSWKLGRNSDGGTETSEKGFGLRRMGPVGHHRHDHLLPDLGAAAVAEAVRTLKCTPESVDVIFEDVKKSDWASASWR